MGLFADARFKAALVGLVVAGISWKFPGLDATTANTVAATIVTFLAGLLIPAPGTAAKVAAAKEGGSGN
jgi:hypothetical protein